MKMSIIMKVTKNLTLNVVNVMNYLNLNAGNNSDVRQDKNVINKKEQSYHHKKDKNNKKAKKEKKKEVPESDMGEIPEVSATNGLNAFNELP